MTKRQQKIYEGLMLIGEDIAGFYRGGLEILYSHNPVKAHLLAHCGRELDGIMRETFSYEDDKNSIQKGLKSEDLESIKKTIGKNGINGNVASVLAALNVSINSNLAKKWIIVSAQFAENAHRDSKEKKPRKFDKCEELWEMYEDVLFQLIGNFNSIHDRVSRIINRPNEQIIDRLPNLFKNKALKLEFFKELNSIEWLIPLSEKGFFNPASIENEYPSNEDNSRLISPSWIELSYLIKVAQLNSSSPKEDITICLNQFILSYIEYRDVSGNPIKNYLTDTHLIDLIINLPSQSIEDSYLDFMFQKVNKHSFILYNLIEHFIPKLLKDDAKAPLFRLIVFFLEPKEIQQNITISDLFDDNGTSEISEFESYKDYDSLLSESLYLGAFHDKIHIVAEKYGVELFDLLKEIISKIITPQNEYLLYTTNIPNISTIENDYYENEPFKIIIQTAYKILSYSTSDISETIRTLFNSEEEIYQRLSLLLLAEKYDEYGSIFWELSITLTNKRYFDFEFSLFIQNNISKFSGTQIDSLIGIIETYDSDYLHNNKYTHEENEEYRCFEIWKFLSLLRPKSLKQIEYKIEEYFTRSKRELSEVEIDFSNGMKISWSSDENIPESASSFNEKSVEEIREYLRNFDEKDRFGRLLKGGVCTAYYKDIVGYPDKYFLHLNVFIDVESDYFDQIINAIQKLCNDNNGDFLYWSQSFEFIDKWLSNDGFKHENILKAVLRLIEDFTQNDSTVFDILLMPIAKTILFNISTRVSPKTTNLQKIEHNWFNVDYAHLIHAFMSFSLRDAIINKKEQDEKWDVDIKNWIESQLKDHPSIDLHMALGLYFTNFEFLSKGWFLSNIDLLLPQNDNFWIATLSTNTFRGNISPQIYRTLINHGDYKRVLEYDGDFIKLDLLQERVINNICWFYLAKVIDETLGLDLVQASKRILEDIISKGKAKQLRSIIACLIFQWGQEEKLQENDTDFRFLIRMLYEVLKNNIERIEYKELMGQLNETINLLANLDEEAIGWIKFSIKYLNTRGNTKKVFEGLKLHSQNNLKQVGEILIEFSKEYNSTRLELYGTEDLKYLVDSLYQKEYYDIADEICDNFGNNGFQKLKPVYDKYHPI